MTKTLLPSKKRTSLLQYRKGVSKHKTSASTHKTPTKTLKPSKTSTLRHKTPTKSHSSHKSLTTKTLKPSNHETLTKTMKPSKSHSSTGHKEHHESLSRDKMDYIRRIVGSNAKSNAGLDTDYKIPNGTGGQPTRFYDDSPDNVRDVARDMNIECIQVPRSNKVVPKGSEDGGSPHDYARWVKKRGGWDLEGEDRDIADVLDYYLQRDSFGEEDTSDSLTESMMRDLRTWAQTNRNARCVIFDFDRVINLTEGIMSFDTPSDLHDAGLTVSGLTKYHMGTKQRMQLFRRVLNELVRREVSVHVVSNNEAALTKTFVAVLHNLHPVFSRESVHASKDFPTKLHCIRQRGLTDRAVSHK